MLISGSTQAVPGRIYSADEAITLFDALDAALGDALDHSVIDPDLREQLVSARARSQAIRPYLERRSAIDAGLPVRDLVESLSALDGATLLDLDGRVIAPSSPVEKLEESS